MSDLHFVDECRNEVFGILPRAELYGTTGIQIMDFNTVFQLYAQKKEGSTALKEAEALLFMPDLLSYLLTGERVCEYTDASTSGMMNQRSRAFEKPLLERLGIEEAWLERFPAELSGGELQRFCIAPTT